MADLPTLAPTELRTVVERLHHVDLLIGKDRVGEGTNLLGLRPPTVMPTCFGNIGSYGMHKERGQALELSVETIALAGIAFDVDTDADLEEIR